MREDLSQIRRCCKARAERPDGGGFSLIELLVVISIIVLLVAVLVPSLSRAKSLARRASCLSNLRNLGSAAGAYQSCFGDYVPICWKNLDPNLTHPWKSWRTNLLPYTSGFASFNCPAASDWGRRTELFHSSDEAGSLDWEGTANAGSYGVMYQYSRPSYTAVNYSGIVTQGHPVWSNAFSSRPGVAWHDPAASLYVADACFTSGPVTYPSEGYKGVGTSTIQPPSEPGYANGSPTKRFADRHVGTNCLLVDGHIQCFETRDLDSMVPGSSGCIWDVD